MAGLRDLSGSERVTSADAAIAIAERRLAVLAIGAVEQHGAHLPLVTDTVLAHGVARRVAQGLGAWLLPPLAYGDAWNNEGLPGTLSLSPETLRAVLIDLGRGLKRMGVQALIVINGHFGNREPIALAARRLVGETALKVMHLDYPKLEMFAAEIVESLPAGPGFFHADEVETSMMLALAPETVQMELAAAEYPSFPETFGLEPMHLASFNRSGVFGDPRPATAEKGEALIGSIVDESLRLIRLWRDKHGV